MIMGFTPTVLAAENTLPGSGYWTDVAGLSGFNMTSSGATIGKIKFGLDGGDSRIWAIAGVDANDNNALSLLAITTFGMDDGLSPYPTAPYAATEFVMNMDNYLSASFFSTGEKAVINPVTVKSWEFAGWDDQASQPLYAEITVSNKLLYEPNSYDYRVGQCFPNYQTIFYVGVNNDIAIELRGNITEANGFYFSSAFHSFQLRNCDDLGGNLGAVVSGWFSYPDLDVSDTLECGVLPIAILPALNLNPSNILFASAADEASPSYIGAKPNSSMTANTYTIRYQSLGSEAAYISDDGSSINAIGASGKYLMIQNADGVYALAISSDSQIVNASSITIAGTELDNFNNCRVWLESTDTDRITTAKFALNGTPHTVVVNSGTGDGLYVAGATVTVAADAAPFGKEFDQWIMVSGGVVLASSTREPLI